MRHSVTADEYAMNSPSEPAPVPPQTGDDNVVPTPVRRSPAPLRSTVPPSLVGRRIGEIMLILGFADDDQVNSAVDEARETGRPTGRVLLDRGKISKDELAQAI